jgi:hypothetical protein
MPSESGIVEPSVRVQFEILDGSICQPFGDSGRNGNRRQKSNAVPPSSNIGDEFFRKSVSEIGESQWFQRTFAGDNRIWKR